MILCMVPRGPGGEADLKVVANGRVMNLMGAVAFELPKVTSIQPSNSPTFGGIFVTLSGSCHAPFVIRNLYVTQDSPFVSGEHFGFLDTSPNMGLASSGCEESHWISDSSMLCKIFPGVGGNLAVMAKLQPACSNATVSARSYAQQVGINPGWTPHVQKVPQKAVAKAKLLIESRQQKRVLNIGGSQATRGEPWVVGPSPRCFALTIAPTGDIVQTEVEQQEADKKAAAAAEVERKAAAAAAAVTAAKAKALEDEKVRAYLEKKAAMEAAKVSQRHFFYSAFSLLALVCCSLCSHF
jgi:hypothetical protein